VGPWWAAAGVDEALRLGTTLLSPADASRTQVLVLVSDAGGVEEVATADSLCAVNLTTAALRHIRGVPFVYGSQTTFEYEQWALTGAQVTPPPEPGQSEETATQQGMPPKEEERFQNSSPRWCSWWTRDASADVGELDDWPAQ